ncbi:MAG: hypothetical protein HGA47_15790, partial [Zoogloea sp.]|nr:hypothetical protein [Zoogloea sp.]
MKRKTILHLALAAVAFGTAASASAECWSERIGERTGINYNDPQCSNYVGDMTGKAAYGKPATEEAAPTYNQPPASRDCTDPAFRNDPQCVQQPGQQMAPGSDTEMPEGGG